MTTYFFASFSFTDPNNFNVVKNYHIGDINGPEATALPGAGDTVFFTESGFGNLTVDSVDSLWLTSGSVTANSATGTFTTAGDTGAAATITINGTINGHVRSRQGGTISAENATGTVQSLGGIITITNAFTVTSHGANSIDLSVSTGGTVNIEGGLDVRNTGGQVFVGRGTLNVAGELQLGVFANNAVINIFDTAPGAGAGGARLVADSIVVGSETVTRDDCGEWQHTGNNGYLNVGSNGYVSIADTLTLISPGASAFDYGATINLLSVNASMQIGGNTGPVANRLTIDSGGTLEGHGRIDAGTIVNNGTVMAAYGTLRLGADISGSGIFHIADGATIEIDGAVAAGPVFMFDDRAHEQLHGESILRLRDPGLFEGTITGFQVGDTIEMSRFDFQNWLGGTYAHSEVSGHQLIVTSSTGNQGIIDLSGLPANTAFDVRQIEGAAFALSFKRQSPKIESGSSGGPEIDGAPTGNPYIDALIWGWGAWKENAGPIRYWFGGAGDVHNAIAVHGDTEILPCGDATVNGWTANEKAAFQRALSFYSAVTDLEFLPATSVSTANIVWWLTPSLPGGVLGRSEIPAMMPGGQLWQYFDDAPWKADPDQLAFGGDGNNTIVHEIGHTLGLAHPHDGGYEPDSNTFPGVPEGASGHIGLNGQNQSIFSVMSYVPGWNGVSGVPTDTYGTQGALGAFDIAALQVLYGAGANNTGNTAYQLPQANAAGTGWSSIWDTGGIDTIINPGNGASSIDLRAAPLVGANAGGFVSFVDDILGGFTIANGALIENATGGGGSDVLQGNGAANVLNGRGGADIMRGAGGNDTYIVDNVLDKAIEGGGDGTDTVRSSVTFSLAGQGLEILELTGAGNINGTGNALANTIIGNGKNNVLDGGAGADTMKGNAGNDTYVVDNTGDIVDETGGSGADTVRSSISFSLAASTKVKGAIEHLTLTGSGNINGTGNTLANTITGNARNNTLDGGAGGDILNGGAGGDVLIGGAGKDTLTGGIGKDFFLFNAALSASTNVDTITDFKVVDDTIRLDNAIFAALADGNLLAGAFFKGSAAADAGDRIIYNGATGALLYDADGTGAAAAIKFATLSTGLALTHADFVIV